MHAPAFDAPVRPAAGWRRVLAAMLDFCTVFFGGGFVIAAMTGGLTPGGFQLNGWPAGALLVLIAAYFIVLRRWAGGTLWDRALGIRRPQP